VSAWDEQGPEEDVTPDAGRNSNREDILDSESTVTDTVGETTAGRGRLGVYVDTIVDLDPGDEIHPVRTNAASLAFLTFVCEVGSGFPGLTIFARQSGGAGADFPLPGRPAVAGLPYYPVVSPRALAANAFATVRAMWRHLDDVDHVWVFGPHPFGLLLVLSALARRRRVTLGVRQETLAYFASRTNPRARRTGLPLVLRVLDASWRPVGPRRALTGPIRLLAVGRLAPEKNPMLLLDALAMLHARSPGRFRLTWVGDGELGPAVRKRVAELGMEQVVSLPGFVPVGEELMGYYRRCDLFVHAASTEAFGQVLVEAQANAVPIVATDVGGVGAVLEQGRAGVLVPPGDPAALAGSIDRLVADDDRLHALVKRGRELAELRTLEETSASTAAFLAAGGRRRVAG
jgi:glycosyltransferase involved in cell wall biosynthesis